MSQGAARTGGQSRGLFTGGGEGFDRCSGLARQIANQGEGERAISVVCPQSLSAADKTMMDPQPRVVKSGAGVFPGAHIRIFPVPQFA